MPKAPSVETNETGREIIYTQVETRIFESGGELLAAEDARQLLGWTEPEEGESFDQFHIKDNNGSTIYCSNVDLQRPFYKSQYETLMWDILSGNWQFNLETVIIGETGLVLDGKHRLVALVLASQEYERNPERYPVWDGPPELEIVVAVGAKETKRLANTIGTGKPRSLADSFYASGLFDSRQNPTKMKRLCRMAEHSVRLLWTRTGAYQEAYTSKFSHSDALNFIERHSTLLTHVLALYEENDGKHRRIDSLAGAYAPALMYLMAVSDSDPAEYRQADPPTEDLLSFENEDLAASFWYSLAQRETTVTPIIGAIAKMSEEGNLKEDERVAVLVKGWNQFRVDQMVDYETVELDVSVDEFGIRKLLEDPTLGGIDLGSKESEE